MPSVVYEGLRYVQQNFKVECLKCTDTIESRHNRDFQTCKCGSVSVDGGIQCGRILGAPADYCNKSMWTTEGPEPRKTLPEDYWICKKEPTKASVDGSTELYEKAMAVIKAKQMPANM